MQRGAWVSAAAMVWISGAAFATTFGIDHETCPICDNPTTVSVALSYGSYIYEWDSKYDLIYFPYDGSAYFWYCPNCGYVQLAPDFAGLSDESKGKVKLYLDGAFKKGENLAFAQKMERTRKIAEIRGEGDDYFALLNRIMIYNYRDLNRERMEELATEEIGLLESGRGALRCDPKSRYYLLGEYYRLLGQNAKAVEYLHKSIETHAGWRFLQGTILTGISALALLLAGILALLRKSFSRRRRIAMAAVCLTLATLFGIFAVYLDYRYQGCEAEEAYFRKLAVERLGLIADRDSWAWEGSAKGALDTAAVFPRIQPFRG